MPPCRIETSLPCFLPPGYVEDQNERMALYKRFARFEWPWPVCFCLLRGPRLPFCCIGSVYELESNSE